MPGYVKVNGSQQPVAAPYVKVAGEWKPVALGYVKVAGEWKVWHTAEIVDDFNRADSASLGIASNGFSVWTELSGDWELKNNGAYHGSTNGPSIATTPLYKASTDYSVQIDIDSNAGLGVAFWVQDANNWYAAIPGVRTKTIPSFYSCPSGYTLEGTQCTKPPDTYPASYESDSTYAATANNDPIYGCPSGYSVSGSQCRKQTGTDTSTYSATCTTTTVRTCPSGYSGPSSTGRCSKTIFSSCSTVTGTSCVDPSSCPGLKGTCVGVCGGGFKCSCKTSSTSCKCPDGRSTGNTVEICSTDTIFATRTDTTTCSCPSGGSLSGTTCTTSTPIYDFTSPTLLGYGPTYYTCPSGGTLSGTTCTVSGRGYYCPSGGSLVGDTCTITYSNIAATLNPSSTSYPSTLRIYRNLSGVISTVFNQDVSSDAKSMKVTTSGNNINVSLYNTANLSGSRIASLTYTAAAPIKARGVGIAKNGQQAQRNGTRIDNFKAE